jgi:hypothetical protein
MTDIIERAEALNLANRYANREQKAALVPELVTELKAARAELITKQYTSSQLIEAHKTGYNQALKDRDYPR